MELRYTLRLSLLLFCLWIPSGMLAQEESYDVDDSMIPPRPATHIYDAAKWLSAEEEDRLESQLALQYRENKIDMYLVTQPKHPVQGASTYARTLGEAWSRAPVWCVIFYVPGDPSGFHVQAAGVGLDPARVNRAIAEASKRARREITEKDRIMAAWSECAEVLRFMDNARDRSRDAFLDKREEVVNEVLAKEKRKKIIMVVAAGAFCAMIAGATFFFTRKRKKRCPAVFEFPETSWRTRYQAPYSGGSGLVASCRVKKKPALEKAS